VLGDGGFTGGGPTNDAAAPEGSTPAPDATAASEAGPPDATGAPDADAGPPNLLANGDFELGCANGWTSGDPFQTTQQSAVAHGGAHSCRICSAAFDAGDGVSVFFFSDFRQPLASAQGAAGQTYASEIWVRNDLTSGPAFDQATVVLEELDTGGAVLDHSDTVVTTPSGDWVRVGVEKTLTVGGGSVRFTLSLRRQNDHTGCILVDDAVVTKN
jgi:hypothetical protein